MTGTDYSKCATIYDVPGPIKKTNGEVYDLSAQKGKVLLMVNTASACGFTPQFEGLEKLYQELKPDHADFVILGFPCNQFGSQDPGTNAQISEFCTKNYGVSFDVMEKIDVNESTAHPVWEWMKHSQPGVLGLKRVKWNFEKFLIGRDGTVKGRWASTTGPATLKQPILDALSEAAPTVPSATSTAPPATASSAPSSTL